MTRGPVNFVYITNCTHYSYIFWKVTSDKDRTSNRQTSPLVRRMPCDNTLTSGHESQKRLDTKMDWLTAPQL